ncbi:hypothetical protein PY546_19500 [Providencia stuartii]|nr:hypothetical protein [Providencia stuartii]
MVIEEQEAGIKIEIFTKFKPEIRLKNSYRYITQIPYPPSDKWYGLPIGQTRYFCALLHNSPSCKKFKISIILLSIKHIAIFLLKKQHTKYKNQLSIFGKVKKLIKTLKSA